MILVGEVFRLRCPRLAARSLSRRSAPFCLLLPKPSSLSVLGARPRVKHWTTPGTINLPRRQSGKLIVARLAGVGRRETCRPLSLTPVRTLLPLTPEAFLAPCVLLAPRGASRPSDGTRVAPSLWRRGASPGSAPSPGVLPGCVTANRPFPCVNRPQLPDEGAIYMRNSNKGAHNYPRNYPDNYPFT